MQLNTNLCFEVLNFIICGTLDYLSFYHYHCLYLVCPCPNFLLLLSVSGWW